MNKIFIILLSGVIGLVVGFGMSKVITKSDSTQLLVDPFYTSQSALVNGQITSVDTKTRMITVKNKQNASKELELADTVAIVKPGNVSQTGLPTQTSNNLGDIELNKDVGITLQVINGKVMVTNIISAPTLQGTLAPPTPPPPARVKPSNLLLPIGDVATKSTTLK